MGEVIRFPDESSSRRRGREMPMGMEPATVIILPVVRIERAEEPSNLAPQTGTGSSGKRRRRRATR